MKNYPDYPVNNGLLFTDEEMEKMRIKYPLEIFNDELKRKRITPDTSEKEDTTLADKLANIHNFH